VNSKAKAIHTKEYRDYFRFAGQVIAKALFEKIPIGLNLNDNLLKQIVMLEKDYEK
jgi:hypothetical protein